MGWERTKNSAGTSSKKIWVPFPIPEASAFLGGMRGIHMDDVNLCMALLSAKRFTEAIAAAERAVDLAPSDVGPHINMVSALSRANEDLQLDTYLDQLRENSPEIIQSPVFQERLKHDPDFI